MSLEIFEWSDLPPSLQIQICDFLESQGTSHPFQYPQWDAERNTFAVFRDGGALRWYASCAPQYPLGARIAFCRALNINRGPVCDDPELLGEVLGEFERYMKKRTSYVYIDCSPDQIQRNRSLPIPGGSRSTLRLDLTRSPEELFLGFRKNTRYEIHRAERVGVNVYHASTDEHVTSFLRAYTNLASRKDFLPDPAEHLRKIVAWLRCEHNRGILLLAEYEGTTLGGAVVVRSGRRCWYVWGASQKHRDVSGGHLLQWRALLWAKSLGCTEYDFGGYTPGATSGPAWFKQGFGGSPVEFIQPQRRILRSVCSHVIQLARRLR